MSEESTTNIGKVRQRIDEIDDTILELLQERIAQARHIGRLKNDGALVTWDPRRECEIYQRILRNNESVFPEESLQAIYHEIITTCRLSQQQTTIAFAEEEAAWAEMAALRAFGYAGQYRSVATVVEVFGNVAAGRADYGVVIAEQCGAGTIFSTLEAFARHQVKICGEIVLSHPPRQDSSSEDSVGPHDRVSRCFIIGKQCPLASGTDKTSLLFRLDDGPKVLNEILGIVRENDCSVLRLESRFVGGDNLAHLSFMELDGYIESAAIQQLCAQIEVSCNSFYYFLGSYPQDLR